jgi:hypothetical protein
MAELDKGSRTRNFQADLPAGRNLVGRKTKSFLVFRLYEAASFALRPDLIAKMAGSPSLASWCDRARARTPKMEI